MHDGRLIFRVSALLGSLLKVEAEAGVALAAERLTDWSAHGFMMGRVRCVLVVNTAALYGVVMPGKGVIRREVFGVRCLESLFERMRHDGYIDAMKRIAAFDPRDVVFAKACNRGVTGSMNDLIRLARAYLESGRSFSEASARMNTAPMSYLDYLSPEKAFGRLLDEGSASSRAADV